MRRTGGGPGLCTQQVNLPGRHGDGTASTGNGSLLHVKTHTQKRGGVCRDAPGQVGTAAKVMEAAADTRDPERDGQSEGGWRTAQNQSVPASSAGPVK